MRWIVRGVFLVVVLVVAGLGVLAMIPAERIAGLAGDQIREATGREVAIGGDISPSLWPELGVSTGPVTIANADWSEGEALLAADSLSIGVDARALLGGEIRIKRVIARAPQIVLERAADGRVNWELALQEAAAAADAAAEEVAQDTTAEGAIPSFSLDIAEITDGSVTFIDGTTGTRTTLTGIDANVALPSFDGMAELTLKAIYNGQAVSLDGRIDGMSDFLSAGAVPVRVTGGLDGAAFSFDGRAGLTPMAAAGQIEASLTDPAPLFAMLGQPAPALPADLRPPYSVAGEVTYTDDALNLRDGRIEAGKIGLTAAADVVLTGDRPRLTARIEAGTLDLSRLVGGGGGEDSATASAGWPRDAIDVSALQLLDAELLVRADAIDLGLARLTGLRTLTRLDAGRAVTEIQNIGTFDGTLSGNVVVNSRGGLSLRVDIDGRSLALQPLLAQMADFDRLSTSGDLDIDILASGNSVHDLVHGLSGQGAIRFGPGELRGFDLAGMIRSMDVAHEGAGAKTIFDSISASYTINGGVLINSDLAFKSPVLDATGEGVVALGLQTLDYKLTPRLFDNEALSVPLRVYGSWTDPSYELDLKSAAEALLNAEADKLVEQATEEAQRVVTEEADKIIDQAQDTVGGALGEGVGNAVGEGVGNAVGQGLRGLLGGN